MAPRADTGEIRTAHDLARWQGYLTEAEVDFLQDLTYALPPNLIIVNIGAGAGTSTLSFLEARSDATVFSVDILLDEAPLTTNEHLRLLEIEPEDAARVIRVWGDSKVVGAAWPYKVDMVFVDGDHTRDGLQGDIDAWLPKVKVGGVMAFHDYTRKHWPDVKPVVDAAMVDHERIDHVATTIAFKVRG